MAAKITTAARTEAQFDELLERFQDFSLCHLISDQVVELEALRDKVLRNFLTPPDP